MARGNCPVLQHSSGNKNIHQTSQVSKTGEVSQTLF